MKTQAQHLRIAVVVGFWLMVLVGAPGVPGVFAGSSVGNFEIDGNLADDSGSGDPIDWQTPPPNRTTFTDASGKGDTIFAIGSKELEPGGWQCVTGSAPSKDDVVSGAIALRTIGTERFMFVNYQRAGVNGDAHIDWEFSQSTEPNPVCPALPKRTAGDVVLTFDTEQGGKKIIVRAFQWTGDATSGRFVELPLGSQGDIWDGAVNIPNTVPGLQPGAFGEAALNITASPLNTLCPAVAYMKTRASTAITAELKDRTAAVPIGFVDHPEGANARGSAFGVHVQDTLLGINITLPVDDDAHLGTAAVDSSQSGVGSDSDAAQVLNVDIPGSGDILRADVLSASSRSTITDAPSEANHISASEAINVNILNGLVTASLVRGVATTTSSGTASSFSSLGSTFKDLVVNGVAINDVTPNTRIDLPALLYGPGSFVILYERLGSTSTPAPGQISGGTFAASLTVNMIKVHVTNLLGTGETVDLVVSNAVADSDFPQRELCAVPPEQTVSGHALIASASTDPALLPTIVGFVSIRPTGGLDRQDLDEMKIPADGSTVGAEVSVSQSSGELKATESEASSFAQATDVCVLPSGSTCTVGAQLLRAQSNSLADAGGASSDDTGTQLLGVTVAGTTVGDPIPPNTKIDLGGLGFVVLNEQVCDNDGTLATNCSDGTVPGHSGRTVRAIHLVVTVPANPLGLTAGAEIIVSEAHSDAGFAE